MTIKNSYNYDELIDCANGNLFGPENGRLPTPPMLMFDRITQISDTGGTYNKGIMIAELDVKPDLWFFDCHFVNDPVMPGCLGLDAMWQLVGFFPLWAGQEGRGRALGAGELWCCGVVVLCVVLGVRMETKRKLHVYSLQRPPPPLRDA